MARISYPSGSHERSACSTGKMSLKNCGGSIWFSTSTFEAFGVGAVGTSGQGLQGRTCGRWPPRATCAGGGVAAAAKGTGHRWSRGAGRRVLLRLSSSRRWRREDDGYGHLRELSLDRFNLSIWIGIWRGKGSLVNLHNFPLKFNFIIESTSNTKLQQNVNVFEQRHVFLVVWSQSHTWTVSTSQFSLSLFSLLPSSFSMEHTTVGRWSPPSPHPLPLSLVTYKLVGILKFE
jgi:hypothetical protein